MRKALTLALYTVEHLQHRRRCALPEWLTVDTPAPILLALLCLDAVSIGSRISRLTVWSPDATLNTA